jgi:hypothetical protein
MRGFFIAAAAFFGGMVIAGVVAERARGGEAEAGREWEARQRREGVLWA